MFDIFGLKALTARLSAVERTVTGDSEQWGLVQHIHGTGKRGQEGLWDKIDLLSKKIEQLEQQNRDLRHKVEELQGLESLIKKAIEKNPELLVKLYDVNKLEQKLVEAVNAQLGNVN